MQRRVRIGVAFVLLQEFVLVGCRDRTTDTPRTVAPSVSVAATPTSSTEADDAIDASALRTDAASATQASKDDALFGFVGRPPRYVHELAAALHLSMADLFSDPTSSGMGSFSAPAVPLLAGGRDLSADVSRLSALYNWDVYHHPRLESATAVGKRGLTEYTVYFVRGRSACERALASSYGVPRVKVKAGQAGGARVGGSSAGEPYRQYGPFFVPVQGGEAFSLEWYAREPDWAKPRVDPDARRRALRDLASAVRGATTQENLVAAIGAIPSDVGVRAKGSLNPGDQSLELEPPMSAVDFAAAIGAKGAIGESIDVHMSVWQLVIVSGSRTALPHLGPWELEARLDGRASGAAVALFAPGPTARRGLGPNDVVRHVRIAPTRSP